MPAMDFGESLHILDGRADVTTTAVSFPSTSSSSPLKKFLHHSLPPILRSKARARREKRAFSFANGKKAIFFLQKCPSPPSPFQFSHASIPTTANWTLGLGWAWLFREGSSSKIGGKLRFFSSSARTKKRKSLRPRDGSLLSYHPIPDPSQQDRRIGQ